MTDQLSLERLVTDVLRDGPQTAPSAVISGGIEMAARENQRRALPEVLDRRAWPPPRRSIADPAMARSLRFVLLAALVAALATALAFAGSRLIEAPIVRPISLVHVAPNPGAILESSMLALLDGRLFVAGVSDDGAAIAAVIDLKLGTSTRVEIPVAFIQAIDRLPDGRVAILAEVRADPSALTGRSELWMFDPSTDRATLAGVTSQPHFGGVMVALRDGRALVAGGVLGYEEGAGSTSLTEAFNPTASRFTILPPMTAETGGWTVALNDGRVLIGGFGGTSREVAVYDPASGATKHFGGLPAARSPLQAKPVALVDGRVWIPSALVGETCGFHRMPPMKAYLFDPADSSLTPAANAPHLVSTAAALSDGRLVIAGQYNDIPGGCSEVSMDPVRDAWLAILDPITGDVRESRSPVTGLGSLPVDTDLSYIASALLPDGSVALLAGDDQATTSALDVFYPGDAGTGAAR